MKRKVCIINDSRSTHGVVLPLMLAIQKDPNLELQIVVTGMHLLRKFGYTIKEVESDGFKVDYKFCSLPKDDDSNDSMVIALGKEVIGMTNAFKKLKPDFVFVTGDRSPALAAAIVAAHMNIPILHHSGGDITLGNIDGPIRHSITRFAHIHLPMTEHSKKVLIKTGEEEWRIHVVGCLSLDAMSDDIYLASEEIMKKFDLNLEEPKILVIQHPITAGSENLEKLNAQQIRETLEAIVELGFQTIFVYPNSDAGSKGMIKIIKEYKKYPFIRIYKSIPFRTYLSLMKNVDVMVGNSSGGLSEAPFFELPVVNVGMRNRGREATSNIIFTNAKKEGIVKSIKIALNDKKFKKRLENYNNPFASKKNSCKLIIDIIKNVKINDRLLVKRIKWKT